MAAVLGELKPNWIGEALGTGYRDFSSTTGIMGLARVDGKRLDLLAVIATKQGTGQFRTFIDACKKAYESVYVWELLNPKLNVVLERYGFERATEVQDGEELKGWKWSHLAPPPAEAREESKK